MRNRSRLIRRARAPQWSRTGGNEPCRPCCGWVFDHSRAPSESRCLLLCVLSASSASYRSSKVIHRRRGEPGFASPQTTVSNFGGRQKMGCEKLGLLLNPPIEHAGSGRRILHPNVATFSQRLSLRNPAPCRKGMLRTLRLQAETWQRRTSISLSIRQGPRAQSTNLN